jgi:hypothetical protein
MWRVLLAGMLHENRGRVLRHLLELYYHVS